VLVDDRMTIATPEGVEVDVVLAGLGSRFLARFLDALLQAGLILALAVVVGIIGSPLDLGGWGVAAWAVGAFAVIFVYDVLFELLASGRTPGKQAAGIRVVGLRGEPVTFRASAVRNVLRIFELVLFYFPAVVSILVTKRNQRLGDLAAGTVVAREKFGGRTDGSVPTTTTITVPAQHVVTWDVSGITADEVVAVRHFLDRRVALPWPVRNHLGWELWRRLQPRIAGAPVDAHPEYVLEGLVVAKQARA
jgi:uncharacterized RDD family membrane protein YckC